jgi:hypothetical protein
VVDEDPREWFECAAKIMRSRSILKTVGVEVGRSFEDELKHRSDDSDIKTKTCCHKGGFLP